MKRALVVVTACLVALVPGCASGDKASSTEDGSDVATYSENGVIFEYPSDWEEFGKSKAAASTGSNELWTATFGLDPTNLVNVTAYQLNIAVTEDNIDQLEGDLDDVIQGVVAQANGEIVSGPTQTTIAGLPAYKYEWSGVQVDDEEKDSNAYFLFKDEIEYFFNCQYSEDTTSEIQEGCNQILNSFQVAEST